jgi:hypothetical protein
VKDKIKSPGYDYFKLKKKEKKRKERLAIL